MYSIERLANGLAVMRIPIEGVESVAMVVMARVGSRYESPETWGVAHFLEHMVFKGTKLYPTNKQISETIDGIGAQFNAFTGEEATAFYIRSAAKDVDLGIRMLGQMVTQALILPEEIERERGVILEEMHMYEDQPDAHNAMKFNQMFYAESGLAHNIIGTQETIKKIEQKDFKDYVDTWYAPDNLLLVVAGKKSAVMQKDLSKKIEQEFVFAPRRNPTPKQSDFWEKEFHYGGRLNLENRKTEQVHFVLGWPGINRFDQREEALTVLSTITGGNMSSRLFSQVRERRGLCYYINSQVESFSDGGFWGAAAGVNPEKLVEALTVTVEEFEKLATGKAAVSEAEVRRAKDFLTGQLTLAQESVYNLAINYGMRWLLNGEVTTVEERLKRLQRVTLAEVRAVAGDLVKPEELRLGLIGELTNQQKTAIKKMVS
jgi:predicted Zn-dependent peptidase